MAMKTENDLRIVKTSVLKSFGVSLHVCDMAAHLYSNFQAMVDL